MYLALQYDLVDDYLDRRPEFRDEHLGLARAAHERGDLALAGACPNPPDQTRQRPAPPPTPGAPEEIISSRPAHDTPRQRACRELMILRCSGGWLSRR